MAQIISNSDVEHCLRACLETEGYKLTAIRKNGETGVDLIAKKENEEYYIEVIGFKQSPPARSKDFYEIFFRAISRLKDGAKNIVIALPERFGKGLHQRASQYGEAWKRIGKTFPELEIWLINSTEPYSYKRTSWNNWLPQQKNQPDWR
ncbi:MAG: restriction endonuclease [Nitrospirota bacterium]